ncbi:MAG: hypothetical protein COX07_01770 [Bacteroidetes bacterium CG23_combo_of_CG06-09_8_20_14_all_32_9]|nr:MAG: hypothetical protein COX07_01770 [Bacteroidetes bacterium CG23_combo_of_CG06-09_8_20_14_all_32_9]
MEEEIINKLQEDDFSPEYKTDYSFSYTKSNMFSLAIFVFSFVIFTGFFGLFWGFLYIWNEAENFVFNAFITVPVLIGGIFLHELLHAVTLLIFTDIKISNLKAGVSWINFTPYIHCKHPVSVSVYRRSTAAPALIMGIIPAIISLFTGYVPLLFFGILFIVTAGSDLFSLWKLRKVKSNYLASDHSERAGCVVYENPFMI